MIARVLLTVVLLIPILCLQLEAFSAASVAFSQLSAETPDLMGHRAKITLLLCVSQTRSFITV